MAQETETLNPVSETLADRLYSDDLYSAPRHAPEPKPADANEAPAPEPQVAEITQPTQQPETVDKVPEFDINKYVKENFGFDSSETAKEAIEKWRKGDTEPKVEAKPKFANEESEKFYNAVLSGEIKKAAEIVRKQEEIEKAVELSPLEQIKLDLQYKYPKYSKDDIEDIVEEKYTLPVKPDEDDLDYDDKIKAYEKEFAKVERRMKRDGQDAVENLQKHKQDLVFPDINNGADKEKFLKQQEDLQKEEEKAREAYKTALDKDYSNFKGYATAYKDKEVDVPIEYKPSEQELKDLKNKFSEGFDADEYFANRWIKTDNNKVVGFNVPLQMEDVHLLENKQKIFDKIATDAASRAVAAYLKGEKNINFNSSGGKTNLDNTSLSSMDKVAAKLFPD